MRELEGRSHAEVAAVLGVTVQATEMLAFRARRALREHLAGSLTCTQAADALDRKSDGTLGPDEEALLRAHLRECDECERAARMLRAQRTAWRALAVVPLPSSLHAFGGGGTAAAVAGTGVAAKVIVVSLAAVTVAGGAYVSKHAIGQAHHGRATTHIQHRPAATQRRPPVATATAPPHAPASSAKARPVAPAPHAPPSHPAHVHPAHPTAPHANNGVRRRPHGIQHGRRVKAP
jgi:hypothetical protein